MFWLTLSRSLVGFLCRKIRKLPCETLKFPQSGEIEVNHNVHCSHERRSIGGLLPEQIPQIVLLTFDDAVNDINKQIYAGIFERGRKNPNGCPISATFYVSHEWTDYTQVQDLYADGHEMASHTVS